jgi:hypothetical protein
MPFCGQTSPDLCNSSSFSGIGSLILSDLARKTSDIEGLSRKTEHTGDTRSELLLSWRREILTFALRSATCRRSPVRTSVSIVGVVEDAVFVAVNRGLRTLPDFAYDEGGLAGRCMPFGAPLRLDRERPISNGGIEHLGVRGEPHTHLFGRHNLVRDV